MSGIIPDFRRNRRYAVLDKNALRAIATDIGGFTEEVPGRGSVQVTAVAERKFKGLLPTLVEEAYLELAPAKRQRLIASGLMKIVETWSKETRPSVTVRI